ncbi:histone H2A-Bbd type 2/3-like [Manis javanica]|uniref:histone H2A-Bbd type 2/3-like n=1 Tax=Manis javanica TaxID=9974 RepID=UPI003C6D12C9
MQQNRRRRASSGGRRTTHSRTDREELLFSVSHVERVLRERHFLQRMSPHTPVFAAAVIQYLTAKVLELEGNEAQKHGSGRITPEIIDRVLHSNPLLSSLFRDYLLTGGPGQ